MAIKKQIISTKEQTNFLLGILIGALLGILGNMLVTTTFRLQDVYEKTADVRVDFLVALLGFGLTLIFLFTIFKSRLNKLGEE